MSIAALLVGGLLGPGRLVQPDPVPYVMLAGIPARLEAASATCRDRRQETPFESIALDDEIERLPAVCLAVYRLDEQP